MRKVFLTFFVLGGILWFGGSIARMVVGYDLFITGTIIFKPAHTETMRLHTVWIFTLLGGWTASGFAAMVVGGAATFFLHRKQWKQQGWMVMCGLLLLLVLPGQIWMLTKDFRLWQLFDIGTGMPLAQPQEIITVFSKRVTDIGASVVSGLTLLIALSCVVILVFRPLKNEG